MTEEREEQPAADDDAPADADAKAAEETATGPLPDGGTAAMPSAAGPEDPDGPGPSPGGSEDDEVEPIEVLVGLAEAGEIDPWDIDIVHVTDRFLEALDEADLRTSGRALFYASVLLRMKSDAIVDDGPAEEAEPDPWEDPFAAPEDGPVDGPGGPDPIDALEAEMDRRLERKRARGTPETLDELVRELRERERGHWWKESREYDTSDSPAGFDRGTQTLDYHAGDDMRMDREPTEDDVTGNTHQEDIEAVITSVRRVLDEHYDAGREEVLFVEIADVGESPVETYLAVLFLSHRGGVRLQQDELFGDLWVQNPTAFDEAARGDDAVVADTDDAESETSDGRDTDDQVATETAPADGGTAVDDRTADEAAE
jgi:segregation and condensation protein A